MNDMTQTELLAVMLVAGEQPPSPRREAVKDAVRAERWRRAVARLLEGSPRGRHE